eukprot:gene12069-biopygen2387
MLLCCSAGRPYNQPYNAIAAAVDAKSELLLPSVTATTVGNKWGEGTRRRRIRVLNLTGCRGDSDRVTRELRPGAEGPALVCWYRGYKSRSSMTSVIEDRGGMLTGEGYTLHIVGEPSLR